MHICFIAHEFPISGMKFGGIGTFLISYSKILIENGHSVSIVGVVDKKYANELVVEGVNIYYKTQSKIKGLAWFFNSRIISNTIEKIHKKEPINIIEAQEAGFAFVKMPKDIRKIIRMHGGHSFFFQFENKKINKWKAWQEKKSFENCNAVISTSEFVKNQTLNYIDFRKKQQDTINNPILMDMFYPADHSKAVRGLAIFAGTLCEKKGIRQLCFAIPKIVSEIPEFHLHIYGRDWYFKNGKSYKAWLLEQLSDEIKSKITFKDPVPYSDLPKVYEQGEICIFPSHIEVQGLVAPEAMSMKKPVVFTKYGPGLETIDDGVNGWLCDTRLPESIANTVIKVFQSREEFDTIGNRARDKVEKKFSPSIVYKKNIQFYKEVIGL